MITIRINNAVQSGSKISSQWIKEQIQNRKKDNQPICVNLEVRCTDIKLNFSLGECPQRGGGSSKQYTGREKKLIKAWENRGFRDRKLNVGAVTSTWKLLQKACS